MKTKIGSKYEEMKDFLIKSLISGELKVRKDKTNKWACYISGESTNYVVNFYNQIFPISLSIINLINEVKVGKMKYENNEFKKIN